MELLARHLVLATAETREECKQHVLDFFDQTPLVRYDRIEVIGTSVYCGTDDAFLGCLEGGIEKNRKILAGFIKELSSTGFHDLDDMASIQQGYPSKIFHVIAHFLDGFIGIDTRFYNLIDDSHWISEETTARIKKRPELFWLFTLDGYALSPKEAALLH